MKILFWRKEEPIEIMRELLELAIKSGRRCAYDMKHAIGRHDPQFEKMLHDRACHWLTIFNSADDMKNYRLKIYYRIDQLEDEIDRLKKLCSANGIDPEESLF